MTPLCLENPVAEFRGWKKNQQNLRSRLRPWCWGLMSQRAGNSTVVLLKNFSRTRWWWPENFQCWEWKKLRIKKSIKNWLVGGWWWLVGGGWWLVTLALFGGFLCSLRTWACSCWRRRGWPVGFVGGSGQGVRSSRDGKWWKPCWWKQYLLRSATIPGVISGESGDSGYVWFSGLKCPKSLGLRNWEISHEIWFQHWRLQARPSPKRPSWCRSWQCPRPPKWLRRCQWMRFLRKAPREGNKLTSSSHGDTEIMAILLLESWFWSWYIYC